MPHELGQCPECRRWILIPGPPPPDQIRCPWCQSELSVAALVRETVLPAEPPAPGRSDGDDPPGPFPLVPEREIPATPPEVGDGDRAGFDSATMPVIDTGRGELASSDSEEVPSPFQPQTSVVRQRTQSPRRHPGSELGKIVAGGLAGLMIAQLMLWWMPGMGGRDPLGLAQQLPTWLQFLVPVELRPQPAPPPARRESWRPLLPPAATRPSRPDREAAPWADESLSGTEVSAAVPPPEFVNDRLPPHEPLGAPRYSGAELQQALARVVSALEQLEDSAGAAREVRMEMARRLYERLCDVAQLASFVDVDDPQLGRRMNAVDALLARLAGNEPLLNLLGRTSLGWISLPSRPSDGVALAGTVRQIEARGAYWETTLELASKPDKAVRLISRLRPQLDPRMPYDQGTPLVVLGSILADPARELRDFPGSGPVVWLGIHRPVSAVGQEHGPGSMANAAP